MKGPKAWAHYFGRKSEQNQLFAYLLKQDKLGFSPTVQTIINWPLIIENPEMFHFPESTKTKTKDKIFHIHNF